MRQQVKTEVWRGLPTNLRYNHTRAFLNYLRRCGDKVRVVGRTPTSIDVEVTYANGREPWRVTGV